MINEWIIIIIISQSPSVCPNEIIIIIIRDHAGFPVRWSGRQAGRRRKEASRSLLFWFFELFQFWVSGISSRCSFLIIGATSTLLQSSCYSSRGSHHIYCRRSFDWMDKEVLVGGTEAQGQLLGWGSQLIRADIAAKWRGIVGDSDDSPRAQSTAHRGICWSNLKERDVSVK